MEPDRWKQIERLYHAALELATDSRGTFLVQACGGDEEMRREAGTAERCHSKVRKIPKNLVLWKLSF